MSVHGSIVRRGGAWLPVLAVSSLGGAAVSLALPAALGRAVDAIVAGSGARGALLLVTLLIAAGVAADLLDTFAGTLCVASTTVWLRRKVLGHLLDLPPATAARFDTGDLVSRVSGNAPQAAQSGIALVTVVAAAAPPVGSLVLLALIDWWTAAAFLAGLGVIALMLRTYTRRTTQAVADYQRVQGELAGRLTEALDGARTIAAAGTVAAERERILRGLPELHRFGRMTWRVLAGTGAKAAIVGPMVLMSVLAVGGLALAAHRITAGELFAAGQYAMQGAGLGGLTGVLGGLARARAGVRRMDEVLSEAPMSYGDRALPEGPGRLELRDVTVDESGRRVLDGVTLDLPGGTVVAVVGRSAAGKSTLAAVAARLRDPDAGTVSLDGVPLDRLDRGALREAVACAFERPVLVGETVGDAIGLGRGEGYVRRAAEAAYAHDWAGRLPDGYATALDAAPMSGGEAQRLGLARAWGARRVLVLDDAMSSVDTATEAQIREALTRDHGGRTRLIVTHRASTAARADLVVWLDGGEVAGLGSHEALWADPGYRAIFTVGEDRG
ncbi:ABC transporter ATP-binding protein [Phytomonospora endophytica]|uniref:ATP-binding cassette subfamily B protein n=1 Tax=Phytomonospora endophytica TaxID=714109 RepID=A0A841FI38_9ACTN|nr:ABC transporter ATP-binding protein [Phytomonospora endophytica]MBB6033508.1 ATP-binding cassette subfamily B protein [Phytomonospora endophytica]GIG64975.1 ABC transporter ATP-binding protein [Phytomonospora endophytica]